MIASGTRQIAFVRRLQGSRAAVEAVERWLLMRGHRGIRAPDPTKDPLWRPTEDHVDGGDVFFVHCGKEHRLEVKQPGIMFTCLDDWPFRREMFLTNVKAVSRWEDWPLAHVIVNRQLSHAAVVLDSTRPHWFRRMVYMRNVDREEDTWIVHPVHAKFVDLLCRRLEP